VFFKWLSVLIGDPTSHLTLTAGSKIAFPENVAREIFQKMTSSLCHDSKSLNQHLPLNLSGITESTLSCLEKLFRLVNMYERRIIMEKDGGFVIESVQLTGLDAFYVIAIQSADEIVCQQAIDYLIYIHMKLGRKLVRREVWREFVEICMTKLETTANAKNTSTSSTQVRHILLLLSTFLNQAYKVENETTADPLEEVLVHVKTQDGRTSLTFRYKLKRTSTVGELRDRIARDANYPADRIRLLNENKVKLTAQGHNKFTLKKAHVFDSTLSDNKSGSNQHVVEAILLIKVESDTSAHVVGDLSGSGRGRNAWETDWEAVRNSICSNNRYLNLLFLLLSHQNGVSEEAWKVLNLLPPDKDMEKRIRSLDGCLAIDGSIQTFPQSFEWSQFLDPHSLPKLLYQMRQLPPINFSDSHPRKEVTEWLKSFLKLGGRTHLEKILLSIKKSNLEAYGDLSMMGLSKLFQLLEFFLFASSVPSSYAMNDQSSNVAPAVFDLIQIISRLGNNEEEESSQMERNKNSIFEEYKISPATYPRADLCNTGVPNYSSCEAGAVINALSFIGAYVLSASQDACKLIEYLENYGNVFIECLGVSKHSDVRRQVLKTITSLSSTENKDADSRMKWCLYFLDLLSMYEGAIIGEEYFKLYTTLLEESEDLREFSFLPACRILCNRIREFRIAHTRIPLQKSFPYADSTSIAQHSDSLLQLVMSTLLTLLKKIPDVLAGALDVPYRGRSLRKVVATTLHEEDDILREIYNKCLFPLQEDTLDKQGCDVSSVQPKCRSALTRSTAFGLLSELSKENLPGLRYLFKIMSEQHSLSPPPEAIGSSHSKGKKAMMKHIDRANEKKPFERSKYVGLKNLGCTCYLNSTMQAFFMMPDFRRDLLCLSSEKCINANQAGTLIFELQSLFAHLESTVKPYFNPKSFALALKSWNGEPIDVSIQQDASEFLTSFFQQVESEVNGAGLNQNLLNKYFGGVFSNELVAEGNRYSERFEPFHFISVPVRDRKNLIESLDAWAEGEKVSYTWEAEGSNEKSTLETHKRISIHKLPKYLIIHLKRFEFDFEMMQQIKLNDRFEFPTNLDMYSYTKEGQYFKRQDLSGAENQEKKKAPEYYQYELTGTVVHLGTANYGHYYSFLREQSERNSNDWYEFNDDVVSRFDHSNIANECFGGAEDSNSLTRNRNSFMLFYTRAQADSESRDLKQKLSLSFYGSFLVVLFRCKIIKFSKSRKDQVYQIGQRYPEIIQKQIAKENKMFWRRRYLYDDQYLIFTCELIQSCLVGATKNPLGLPRFEPLEVRLEAIQLATKFVFGTLWQGGDVTKVLEWKEPLRALYHDELDGCKWFLNAMSENPALVFELLVFNEHDDIRELMSIVLTEAISTTSHFETEDSHLPAHSSGLRHSISVQKLAEGPQLPTSFQFVFQLVTLMPRLFQAPIVHHHHYFSILLDFAQAGRNECLLLVLNGAIGVIFGLLIGRAHSQPLIRSELMRKRDVSEPSPLLDRIEFSPVLMKLLSLLLRCGKPPAIDVENPILPPNILQDFIELADTDLGVLMLDDSVRLLISRANQYTKETKPLEQIIQHLCWESQTMTQKFIKHIMEGIELNDHLEVKPFFRTLNTMLKIRDSLARERLTDSMTKLLAVMASQARYYKATETSIEMLTRLAKRHTGIVRWLQENQMSCVWIEKWLLAHRGPEGYLQLQKTSLLKPSSSSSWVGVSVTSSKLIKSVDRMIARLVPRFRGIFDPQLGLDPFYDSDENPQRLVGKRVRVKWAQDKWYEGSVESFDDKTYEHLVVYDDGDKRQYRMSEKIFYVVDNK
jgi:ubiquitin C-terminal hydrolase